MLPRNKAHAAVAMLKEAVIELLLENPNGLRHRDIVVLLDIPSDYRGNQKNYLSWSVVGLLMNSEQIRREGDLYFVSARSE